MQKLEFYIVLQENKIWFSSLLLFISQNYHHTENSNDSQNGLPYCLSKHYLHSESLWVHFESCGQRGICFFHNIEQPPPLCTIHYGDHAFIYYSLRKIKLTIPIMRKINNIVEENKQSCQPKSSHNQTQAVGPLYLKHPRS